MPSVLHTAKIECLMFWAKIEVTGVLHTAKIKFSCVIGRKLKLGVLHHRKQGKLRKPQIYQQKNVTNDKHLLTQVGSFQARKNCWSKSLGILL